MTPQEFSPTPLSEKKLLTICEAGVLLGLGRSVMYGLIARGEIRSFKIGRARRIPAAALDEFIAQWSVPEECTGMEGLSRSAPTMRRKAGTLMLSPSHHQ